MEAEPTIKDVMTAVTDLAEAVNEGFSGVQTQIDSLKTDVVGIKAVMVTKDYLDERLGRTDGKINALLNVLERKSVITTDDKSSILARNQKTAARRFFLSPSPPEAAGRRPRAQRPLKQRHTPS